MQAVRYFFDRIWREYSPTLAEIPTSQSKSFDYSTFAIIFDILPFDSCVYAIFFWAHSPPDSIHIRSYYTFYVVNYQIIL